MKATTARSATPSATMTKPARRTNGSRRPRRLLRSALLPVVLLTAILFSVMPRTALASTRSRDGSPFIYGPVTVTQEPCISAMIYLREGHVPGRGLTAVEEADLHARLRACPAGIYNLRIEGGTRAEQTAAVAAWKAATGHTASTASTPEQAYGVSPMNWPNTCSNGSTATYVELYYEGSTSDSGTNFDQVQIHAYYQVPTNCHHIFKEADYNLNSGSTNNLWWYSMETFQDFSPFNTSPLQNAGSADQLPSWSSNSSFDAYYNGTSGWDGGLGTSGPGEDYHYEDHYCKNNTAPCNSVSPAYTHSFFAHQ